MGEFGFGEWTASSRQELEVPADERRWKDEAFDVGPGSITMERYSGKIYCVEVPDHIIYVRRNGKQ